MHSFQIYLLVSSQRTADNETVCLVKRGMERYKYQVSNIARPQQWLHTYLPSAAFDNNKVKEQKATGR